MTKCNVCSKHKNMKTYKWQIAYNTLFACYYLFIVYTHYLYIYIYMYIHNNTCYVCIYIYIYTHIRIYIYIYRAVREYSAGLGIFSRGLGILGRGFGIFGRGFGIFGRGAPVCVLKFQTVLYCYVHYLDWSLSLLVLLLYKCYYD